MKQFQFEYKNANNVRRELSRIKRFCEVTVYSSIFFQIFTQETDFRQINEVTQLIEEEFPTAHYYGCQSYGNIIDGKLAKDKTLVVCSIFEYETTKTDLIYIEPTNPDAKFHSLEDLWSYCNELDWIKGIEFTCTYLASGLLKVGEEPISLKEGVQVFGGVAIYPNDIVTEQSYIFVKGKGFSDCAAIAILLGGEDLNIDCSYYNGWEGFGKHFTITQCDGKLIKEIDHQPAMDIYREYLGIEYDEKFLEDTMMFPLMVNQHGVDCIRMPMPTANKKDIELTVEVQNGTKLRLSYGEPGTIIKTIYNHVEKIFAYAPETIRIYSCAIRRNFWGDDRVSLETHMLDGIAATIGFYTRGEILRVGDYLQYFNATIVACLVREGTAVKPDYHLEDLIDTNTEQSEFSTKLLHYLGAVTNEIESQYNRTLSGLALAYKTMYSIDLKENVIIQLDHDKVNAQRLAKESGAIQQMAYMADETAAQSHRELARAFCDLTTLDDRMKGVTSIDCELIGKSVGWFRAQFIAISYDEQGNLEQVIFTTQIIDEAKKREEQLLYLAGTDGQTGLYNRRTYEADMTELKTSQTENRFVYISIDINGLKTANDNIGHAAGDELILATAQCMQQSFGSYGKIYRIGGDEFAAVIFISERQLSLVKKDFEELTNAWRGRLVQELSVSVGYVAKADYPDMTIDEIENLADSMMYQQKDAYYKERGLKRR